jgi:Mg-chelatase subunit ChlD
MLRIIFLIILFSSAKAQLVFKDKDTDLGQIAEAYEIKGDVIIKNESDKKIFLLRADADPGIKVFASKKTLQAGDTTLLVISFIPQSSGKFKREIKLVSSDQDKPYRLSLSGNLNKLKADDKLACFYFGSRKNTSNVKIKDGTIVVTDPKQQRDNSNKMPDNSSEPIVTKTIEPQKTEPQITEDPSSLSLLKYKPNNIVFLVDVSSSMRDSMKLPFMKTALYTLIDAVRDIDKITFITYADSVKVLKEAMSGSDKAQLKLIVDGLKGKGYTRGNKAIHKSQQVAQANFIPEGNNQIFLATDGKFKFTPDDHAKWVSNQGAKKITLTTVAFGNDKEAIKNLKEIALKGEGSFIHILTRNEGRDKLLEEVKTRSKR